jgi:hypothetical protein
MISGLRDIYIEGVDIYFKAASSVERDHQMVGETTEGHLTSNWIPPPPCPPDPGTLACRSRLPGRMVLSGVGIVLAAVESVQLA